MRRYLQCRASTVGVVGFYREAWHQLVFAWRPVGREFASLFAGVFRDLLLSATAKCCTESKPTDLTRMFPLYFKTSFMLVRQKIRFWQAMYANFSFGIWTLSLRIIEARNKASTASIVCSIVILVHARTAL